ncbi:hypothetical protein PM082_003837 [Marasmius tenuissimus]|nr:hypothetical protein PM082_003837 [Marasmius tenuissimus]
MTTGKSGCVRTIPTISISSSRPVLISTDSYPQVVYYDTYSKRLCQIQGCNKYLPDFKAFQAHAIRAHFYCAPCDKWLNQSARSVEQHFQDTVESKNSCVLCKRHFPHAKALRQHYNQAKVHNTCGNRRCGREIPEQSYSSRPALILHFENGKCLGIDGKAEVGDVVKRYAERAHSLNLFDFDAAKRGEKAFLCPFSNAYRKCGRFDTFGAMCQHFESGSHEYEDMKDFEGVLDELKAKVIQKSLIVESD